MRLRRPYCCRSFHLWLAGILLLLSFISTALGQTIEPRPLGRELPLYRPTDDQSGKANPRVVENPAGQISLRDALALALMHNPELATFAWELRATEARRLQAGRPPNPTLSTLVEDIGAAKRFTGPSGLIQPQTTIQLGQLIELGGKRAARRRLATAGRDLTAWDYEAARIDVLTRVSRAYFDVLASQEAVALSQETLQVVEQVQKTVELRVTAGVVSPIEQTKAEVTLASARIESDRAKRTFDANRRRLAVLWGSTSAEFQSVTGELAALPPVPAFTELQQQLLQNPDLARWTMEIAQRQAALDVERAKRIPDVTVNAGYRRFNTIDGNTFLIGGSIQLPIFDRNRGGIREASDRVSKAYEEQRAAQARLTAVLADAYRALSSAQDEVSALKTQVLPGALSAFQAIEEGYRLGKFGYLEVLDAQRTLVSGRSQYLRALTDFHKAAADVERLTGVALADPKLPPSSKP